MIPIITKLAGVTFDNCQENIILYSYPSFRIYNIERDPGYEHDLNAVLVAVGDCKMGYLPKDIAQTIAPLLDAGNSLLAEHVSLNQSPWHETVGLTVKIIDKETYNHV